ncbi:type II secretion system F family protein [Acidithiobacillus ferrivorans]|uniref:type II secretion system F family protein n=1 Tax=Acidithiobacillus ferrivorans TaxID=160808 RepID=UPI001C06AFED|nr:type II secretion system F family protein [Acidithiobacillus ferrivorans]MBU2850905.1 type II secretion system F family protein [Acidithiobacillus ferrivorans]
MASILNKDKKSAIGAAKTYDFTWEASTPDGKEKKKGEMNAVSANIVRSNLRHSGLMPTAVRKVPQPLFGEKGVKEGQLVVMVRQLSTMINAGVPIVQSFELLISATSGAGMKKLLKGILQHLQEGESLSQAMAHFPKYFDRLFVSLIAAGEQGGILDTILLRLAEYREKTLALNKKVKSAMFYPAAIITVMVVVVVILMIFVIPVFSQLFSSFGATLPLLTQVVVNISNWMKGHWYIVVLVPIAAVWLFVYAYKHNLSFKTVIDRFSLKIPVLGDILLKGAVARFMRTLSTMQAAGVPIMEALGTLSKVSGNVIIERSVLAARDDVAGGGRITTRLKSDGVFPIMATQMLAIGEETGAIETMSGKVADFYEADVEESVDRLSTLMEPMIMVVLGIIVGTLVVAMYLPIFKMGAVVTHGG